MLRAVQGHLKNCCSILKFQQFALTIVICPKDAYRMTNIVSPDQTFPSGSTLFVQICLFKDENSESIQLSSLIQWTLTL